MKKNINFVLLVFSAISIIFLSNSLISAQSPTIIYSGPPLSRPMGSVVSPDGTTLYITDFGANAIFSIPVNGGMPTMITSGYPFVGPRGIAISPDGTTLFVAAWGRGEVISLPVTGGSYTILASMYRPHGVVVSPDGSTLYVVNGRTVYSLPVEGGSLSVLGDGNGGLDICVSPDGNTLFISAGPVGLYSLPATGGVKTYITTDWGHNYLCSIDLSADGNTLFIQDYFTSDPIRLSAVYSMPITGGFSTLLIPELQGVGFQSLSPDNTALYGTSWQFGFVYRLDFFRPVTIDIKPGSYPNSINLGSNGNVPVAIFSTEDFDATNVDPLTIELAGAGVRLKGKGTPQTSATDLDGDGFTDLIVHIDTTALRLIGTDTQAILMGETFDGQLIRGTDTVRIVQE